jgi:hypothetical protein
MKNILVEDCVLSRVDVHMGVSGSYIIRRSTLGHAGLNAIGRGRLIVEDSTLHARVNPFLDVADSLGGVLVIHIAQGHNVFPGKALEIERAAAPDSDAGEVDPAVGRGPGTGDRETRGEPGAGGEGGGRSEELPAGGRHWSHGGLVSGFNVP